MSITPCRAAGEGPYNAPVSEAGAGTSEKPDAPHAPTSVMRRTYTAPNLVLSLVLLLAYLGPNMPQVTYLNAMADYHRSFEMMIEQSDDQAGAAGGNLMAHVVAAQSRQLLDRFEQTHTRTSALWVIIGGTRGWWCVTMTWIVVLYVALCGMLTMRITRLRHLEAATQSAPTVREDDPLCRLHQLAPVFFWLSILALIWSTTDWLLNTSVWVPA
jgi:hypothetical protein